MRKKKDTHSFDFRPLGLAIREAREKAGLSRNDLGDKVFYGERHIADIENIGKHPSFQLFHDLVTMFNISVDEYFYPSKKAEKSGSMSILWAQKVELFSQHNICRENYFLGC